MIPTKHHQPASKTPLDILSEVALKPNDFQNENNSEPHSNQRHLSSQEEQLQNLVSLQNNSQQNHQSHQNSGQTHHNSNNIMTTSSSSIQHLFNHSSQPDPINLVSSDAQEHDPTNLQLKQTIEDKIKEEQDKYELINSYCENRIQMLLGEFFEIILNFFKKTFSVPELFVA